MKDFQTRNNNKKPFTHSWFFVVFLLVVLGFFAKSAYASFTKKKNAELERTKYQQRLDNLTEQKQQLEYRINNLKTDRGIEEELRKRFNIVKEGETMIRIIDESNTEKVTQ